MEDPLFDMIKDVQGIFQVLFGFLEFVIGISYVCGKYLTSLVVSAPAFVTGVISTVRDSIELCSAILVDVFQSFIRAVYLIYYGIGQIVDAFYTTTIDLFNFFTEAVSTVLQVIQVSFFVIVNLVASLTVIPEQLCIALSLVGESCMNLLLLLGSGIAGIGVAILTIPVFLLFNLARLFLYLISLPPKILFSIPVSAHVGLLVVLLTYFVYCRFSVRVFLRSFSLFGRRAFNSLRNLTGSAGKPSILRTKSGRKSDGSSKGGSGGGICVVCFTNSVEFLATPCNHLCLCKDCCHNIVRTDHHRCPICRSNVKSYTRVFVS